MTTIARTVPAHFQSALERCGDVPLLIDHEGTVSLKTLLDDAAALAEGLAQAGLEPGTRIGVFADNSRRWILTDLGIQLARCVAVPRGTDTPASELIEIFRHAGVTAIFAHDAKHLAALQEAWPEFDGPTFCLDPDGAPGGTVDALVAEGRGGPSFVDRARAVKPDDLATIIYTSGTTGRPKGVMLSQGNFGHQVATCPGVFRIGAHERFLSILPPWHIFERTVEYIALTSGAQLVYTDRRRFKEDLARYEPTFVPSVPRVWETVYDMIQKTVRKGSWLRRLLFHLGYAVSTTRVRAFERARGLVLRVRRPRGLAAVRDGIVRAGAGLLAALLYLPDRLAHRVVFSRVRKLTGSRLRGAISGGGFMPEHIDRFFQAVGVGILVGYGLTETSPVISVRRESRNVLGTMGTPVPEVEVEVRSPVTGAVLPPGETGIIFSRGPHIMQGYYRDEELTRSVLGEDGWFDTGDLGMMTEEQDLCFRGRAKETIVLSGGENVEPVIVEEAIVASPWIEQAIVVGQDRKTIAALVVPEREAVSAVLGLDEAHAYAALAERDDVRDLLRKEVRRRTSGLRPFECVTRIALLPEALDIENGCLTQTLKPRRHVIAERFASEIEETYVT